MKKVKLLALLLALAMVISMFAACKKEDPKPADGEGEGDTPKETVTITWWHWGEQPKDAEAVIAALNEKSKADLNMVADFIWATGDHTKMNTAVTTGATDDIFFIGSGINFGTTAQAGMAYDITALLDTEAPDLKAFIPESIWKGATVGGKIYAVPNFKDCAGVNYWYGRKEYIIDKADAEAEFKAAGTPWLADATPLMKKLYDCKEPYPHDLTSPLTINFQGLRGLNSTQDVSVLNDARIALPEGEDKLALTWATPNYIKNLKTLNEWFKAGYVNQDCETLQKEPDFNVVQCAQGWEGAEITAWGPREGAEIIISQRTQTPMVTATTGSMMCIFANSKHPAETLKFIQYMNLNAEYRNMLCYGVEGRNWKDNGDGTITQINSDWLPGAWCQSTFFAGLKPVAPAPADMYSKMYEVQKNAKAAPTLGFVPDITPIETEVAACSAIIEKWNCQFVCGTMADVDAALADAQKELNAAGWEAVRDEVQKQLDAYLGK